ncbi:GNAT family protein, partial [Escherichia coli]|nr:GNAT family protein [Escherichia coli]
AELDARNSASAALCERLGMRLEATHLQDLFSKGEWTDSLVYAALASDRPRDHGDAIVVSAVDLRDADGHVLTVRKRGT